MLDAPRETQKKEWASSKLNVPENETDASMQLVLEIAHNFIYLFLSFKCLQLN